MSNNHIIYAVQIPPEEQQFNDLDLYLENVILTGNRNFNSYTNDSYACALERLEELELSNDDVANVCKALEFVANKEYSHCIIHGDSQGEWQGVFYPSEYGDDAVKDLEIGYFNLGSEWIVQENGSVPASLNDIDDDIDGFDCYCYSNGIENIRQEIADMVGVASKQVVLHVFEKYRYTPVYKAL